MSDEGSRDEKAKRREQGILEQKARRDAKLKNALRENLLKRKQKARGKTSDPEDKD